jgi:hypothetical protein
MINPIEAQAQAILTAHQRRDVGSCLCGWSELGKSHPGHQVAMLREAGLLLEDESSEQHTEVIRG